MRLARALAMAGLFASTASVTALLLFHTRTRPIALSSTDVVPADFPVVVVDAATPWKRCRVVRYGELAGSGAAHVGFLVPASEASRCTADIRSQVEIERADATTRLYAARAELGPISERREQVIGVSATWDDDVVNRSRYVAAGAGIRALTHERYHAATIVMTSVVSGLAGGSLATIGAMVVGRVRAARRYTNRL
jgi:hypothetical protein